MPRVLAEITLCRLVAAEATDGFNASYAEALAMNRDIGATRGIDAALQQYNLDALVLPAAGKYTSRPAGNDSRLHFTHPNT
jgi:amidase